MKHYLITAAKCGLSIAILAYLFSKDSQGENFQHVLHSKKHWGWLGFGALACLVAHLISFYRWFLMVRAIKLPLKLWDAMRISFIGLFFNLFAFGVIGGDALRAFYVTREFKNRKSEAIASVIADRVIALLVMFLVASAAFFVFDQSQMRELEPKKLAGIRVVCQSVMFLTVAGFSALSVVVFTPRISKTKWFKRLATVPHLGPLLKKLVAVVSLYVHQPRAVLINFLLSLAVNLFFLLMIYSLATGLFAANNPSLIDHLVIEPIAMVSNAIPLPGGVGGMEFAMDFLYRAFGENHGLVVALAVRFCLLAVSAIGAVVWFLNRSSVDKLVPVES